MQTKVQPATAGSVVNRVSESELRRATDATKRPFMMDADDMRASLGSRAGRIDTARSRLTSAGNPAMYTGGRGLQSHPLSKLPTQLFPCYHCSNHVSTSVCQLRASTQAIQ
jgi:hypothetical protein